MTTISFAYLKDSIVSVTTKTPTGDVAAAAANAADNDNHGHNDSNSNSGSNMSISNVSSKMFNHITVHNVLGESNSLNLDHVTNGTQNTITRKIKDFGMFGAVNNTPTTTTTKTTSSIARKRPLGESKLNDENKQPKQKQNSIPKKAKMQKEAARLKDKPTKLKLDNNQTKTTTTAAQPTTTTTPAAATSPTMQHKRAGTPGRKGLPLPQAVARRNARERNRVKQVNNGFAALRERIPDEISRAFEALGNGRGSSKKLSKVETLRMAVEYIRSLERLLGFDFPLSESSSAAVVASVLASASTSCSSSSGEDSFLNIKDEYDAMLDDEHYDDSMSNYELEDCVNYAEHMHQYPPQQQQHNQQQAAATNVSGSSDDGGDINLDLLPNVTTLNGLQYIRIPGTNTYQLLTADVLTGNASNSSIDDEQFNGLIDANCLSPISVNMNAGQPATINNVESAGDAPAAVAAVESLGSNGECVKFAPSAMTITTSETATLSRSTPGPQTSPTGSSSLHQHQQQLLQPPTSPTPITTTTRTRSNAVSPAAAGHADVDADAVAAAQAANELLLQACAVDRRFVATPPTPQQQQQQQLQQQQQQQQQQLQFIKQAFCNRNLINATTTTTTPSPTAMQTTLKQLIYHQQQQQQLQQQQQQLQQQQQQEHLDMLNHVARSNMSPPLPLPLPQSQSLATTTAATTIFMPSSNMQIPPVAPLPPILAMSPGLQTTFYEHDQNSFYEGVVTLKKEYNDLLLDTSTTTGGLSDESMIDAIDWWEAHTPKSDGGLM